MNETTSVIAGIDVSKAALDVAARPGGSLGRFTNDEAGIEALIEQMKAGAPSLIVLGSHRRIGSGIGISPCNCCASRGRCQPAPSA